MQCNRTHIFCGLNWAGSPCEFGTRLCGRRLIFLALRNRPWMTFGSAVLTFIYQLLHDVRVVICNRWHWRGGGILSGNLWHFIALAFCICALCGSTNRRSRLRWRYSLRPRDLSALMVGTVEAPSVKDRPSEYLSSLIEESKFLANTESAWQSTFTY